MDAAIYSLLGILWWNLIGQYMYYIYAKLSLGITWTRRLLPRFDPGPPQWWLDTWHFSAWWDDNLDNRRPNTAFVLFYRRAAQDRFGDWIENAADRIARPLVNVISGLLGDLLHGYTTFSTWIESIRNIVGTWVPWWTSTLARGLVLLYDWLPGDVTSGLVSFYDKFMAWHETTKSWVRTNYDSAVAWALDAYNWVIGTGVMINNWWLQKRDFLDGFFHFHVSWVARWLGDPWSFLAGAWTDLQDFYNNVWVPFKVGLHDFLDHPVLWLEDRVQEEVAEHLASFTVWVGPIFEKAFLWWVDHG